jgi:hypothetical protein
LLFSAAGLRRDFGFGFSLAGGADFWAAGFAETDTLSLSGAVVVLPLEPAIPRKPAKKSQCPPLFFVGSFWADSTAGFSATTSSAPLDWEPFESGSIGAEAETGSASLVESLTASSEEVSSTSSFSNSSSSSGSTLREEFPLK